MCIYCIISELSLPLPNTDIVYVFRSAFEILNTSVHLKKVMATVPLLDRQRRSQHFTEAEGRLK